MRVVLLLLAAGRYASHGRTASGADAGSDAASDAFVERCREGASCDDGDACTRVDACTDGVCAGVPIACDAPPSVCAASPGICIGGECSYEPLPDGSGCDDGDECTVSDVCGAGTCGGSPRACDSPPPPRCLDGTVLQTFAASGECSGGECRYVATDRACPEGCADGTCICTPRPWVTSTVASDLITGGAIPIIAARTSAVHIAYEYRDVVTHVTGPPGGPLSATAVPFTMDDDVRVRDLVLDGDGAVHLALTSAEPTLFHAVLPAGGTWSFEPIVSPGYDGSLAIDASGTVHVAYTGAPFAGSLSPDLGYAYRTESGFVPETLVYLGEVGVDPSIAVDDLGVIHIVHTLPGDRRILYATRSPAGEWHFEDLAEGSEPAIALAPDGTVHLAYRDDEHALAYARRPRGGPWAFEGTLLSEGGPLGDIAVDRRGRVHVAATERGNLRYGTRDPAGAWTFTTLDVGGFYGFPSIAVDDAGGVHATYFGSTFFGPAAAVRYAYLRVCD